MTDRVTLMGLPPASTSFTCSPWMRKGVSSCAIWGSVGNRLTGASLTGCTSMGSTSLSLRAPPLPVLPRSLVVMVRASSPWKLALPL
ncbi:hypothetical protein D3C80_1544100 [compost metagenome]